MTLTNNKHFKNFKANHTTPSFFIKLGLVMLLVIFVLVPLLSILTNIRGNDISYLASSSKFGYAVLYSLLYSVLSAGLTVIFATLAAYLLSRSNIKGKNIFAILLTIPMLIPTISIGLGIRLIFPSSTLGFGTLTIGSIIAGFPVAFLLLYDSFQYEDKSVYDAAVTMGCTKRVTFFKVTLPYLRKPLISAFIASMVWIFTDYGLPLEIAGDLPTLPTLLYEQAVTLYKYGTSSIISIVLIMPSIASFVFNQFSKESATEESRSQVIKPANSFNVTSFISLVIISIIVLLPTLTFISISFMKGYPNDMTFTFKHYDDAFDPNAATNIWRLIKNSLLLSFFTGVFGSFFAYISAYFSVRSKGFLAKAIDFLAMLSMAIPGLVLGLGYLITFVGSNGWFYGTLAILIAVNCAHFFSSPYILAKNALSKLNKDYEVVGQSLNAPKFSVFWNVLLPNSFSTVIQMFSYFFINSMITISAISFLYQYFNTPLSIEITRFDNTGNYEMQSVISVIILTINIAVKVGLQGLANLVDKVTKKSVDKDIDLSHNEFRVLAAIKSSDKPLTKKEVAKYTKQPYRIILRTINDLISQNAIKVNKDKTLSSTNHGDILIEPYRVRKAIIIAAGFGSRMVPVTLDTPKPLVKVNGKRIIDSLLDALYAQDIKNIYIIRGYLGEQFDQLLEKYPTIRFVDNPDYNKANNIGSIMKAKDLLDRCYICEADLLVANPNIIKKYQYRTNYLGFKVDKTYDWRFNVSGSYITDYGKGGENCVQMVGISYWSAKDAAQLKVDVPKVYHSRIGKDCFYDDVPLLHKKKNYKIAVRLCEKEDVTEIDNFSELVAIDPSYDGYVSKNAKGE